MHLAELDSKMHYHYDIQDTLNMLCTNVTRQGKMYFPLLAELSGNNIPSVTHKYSVPSLGGSANPPRVRQGVMDLRSRVRRGVMDVLIALGGFAAFCIP